MALCIVSLRSKKKKKEKFSEGKNDFIYYSDTSVTNYTTQRCITEHRNLYESVLIIHFYFFFKVVVGASYQK